MKPSDFGLAFFLLFIVLMGWWISTTPLDGVSESRERAGREALSVASELPLLKPTAAPTIPAPPTVSPIVLRTLKALQAGNLCEIEVEASNKASFAQLMEAATRWSDPARAKIFSNGAEALESLLARTFGANSVPYRFYIALSKVDLLQPTETFSLPRNRDEAIAELESLASEHPENGAFALYRMLLEPEDTPEAIEWLEKAFASDGFETFESEFWRRIREPAFQDRGLHYLYYMAQMGGPETSRQRLMQRIRLILQRVIPDLAGKAFDFGLRITSSVKRRWGGAMDLYWNPMNHIVGREIAKTGWKQASPGQPFPPSLDETYQEAPSYIALQAFEEESGALRKTKPCRNADRRLFMDHVTESILKSAEEIRSGD